jgi:hypothetical protein
MLLREMDQGSDFLSSLESVLSLYLSQANDKNGLADIDYASLERKMQSLSQPGRINQAIMNQAVQSSEALDNMIHNVGPQGITLNTDNPPPEATADAQPDLEKTDQGISKTTAQAASRAAEKSLAQ